MLEEKDATVDVTLDEAFAEAEQEENEQSIEESSSQEESSQKEEEVVVVDEEQSKLEDLDNDEEFNEAKKELETEMGGKDLTYAQTQKFRKTYWEAKEGKRQTEELRTQLDELQSKELNDNELLGEAVKRGLLDQDKPQPAEEKSQFNVEELYKKASPEQREWLDIIKNMAAQQTKPMQDKIDEYEQRFGNLNKIQTQGEIQAEEATLRDSIKEKYGLDYDKDIVPEVQKIIPSIASKVPKNMTLLEAGWTPTLLANQVIAQKHMELAKKKVLGDNKKLKETKKKANLETDTSLVQSQSAVGDEDIIDIMEEEMKREGLTQFE